MPYALEFSIALGSSQVGLTLEARLVDTAGVNVGSAIAAGFFEHGLGNYQWLASAIPDGFRGSVRFQLAGGGTLKAIAAINPEEAERIDALVSSRLATAGYTVPPTVGANADAVWDELLAGHLAAGSAGAALSTSGTSPLGPGSISYPVTITEPDLVTPIEGVAVWVTTDIAGTNTIAGTLYSDAFGQVNGATGFMLDAGTYYLWRQRSGWNFANPAAFVVA